MQRDSMVTAAFVLCGLLAAAPHAGVWAGEEAVDKDGRYGAELLANGDFEAVDAGAFASWESTPGPEAVGASAAPAVIGGRSSAKMAAEGGSLLQDVAPDGISNFSMELDFAVLDTAEPGVRSLSIVTYAAEGVSPSGSSIVDSIRIYTTAPNKHEIQVYGPGGFRNCGLFATATPDIGGDLRFDDGETPIVNHLKIAGTGYGTVSQTLEITLSCGETEGSCTHSLCFVKANAALKQVRLYSAASAADYLVDNLSFKSTPPPPPKRDMAEKALALMGGAEEIVFVERGLCAAYQWYATFGEYADEEKYIHAPDGSRLCKLNLRTGQLTVLLDDPDGGFRDPRVHYDGSRILFAYRKGGTHHYHLCEIGSDGSGFRQLTSGDCDDMDPAYLPDGGIVFASSRCNQFIACNRVPTAVLYRMDGDGGNIQRLSANAISEDRPAVLPDGRIVYTRWDYTDRDPEKFRDLWVTNPDGSGQMVLFGGVGRPYPDFWAKCDALPIPGAEGRVVSVFSPGFGHRENAGNVMVVAFEKGPGDWASARQVSPDLPNLEWTIGSGRGQVGFRDPYPLSEDCFLVAHDRSLLVLDGNGNTEAFYQADKMVHDPRAIRPRPREPVIPARIDLRQTTGQLVLTDVYRGRNMAGVAPGTIKKLLVLEDLPKPGSKHGLAGFHGGYLTLRRVLGTVPVEADGSASFEAPALRAVYFVALDAQGVAVKRMQNFTMVMPGETQGCVGCHERRTGTPGSRNDGRGLLALARPPSKIEPYAGIPDVLDYVRDIQPVWDRHCAACHGVDKPSGRVVLTGDNNEWFTQSYSALLARDQVSQCCSWGEDGDHPPYGFGTGASPLLRKIDGSHHDVELTAKERDTVRLWIETGAVFTGTYGLFNHAENAVATPLIVSKPVLGEPVGPIVERRCLSCHGSVASLGRRGKLQRDDQWTDGKPPHWLNYPLYDWNLYNLSHPEKSKILLASLSGEAGGYAWCKADGGQPAPAFLDTSDPDYQAILKAIEAAQLRQQNFGRPDLPGFRPGDYYIRWMKRFGILPENFDPAKDPIDPYETDRAYWRSLWHSPATEPAERLQCYKLTHK